MRWLVLVLTIACGCWSSSEQATERPSADPPAIAVQLRRPAHSVWRGRYVCAQGPTALTLTVDHDGPALAATFDFGPLDENPNVPHGSYSMTGAATTSGGEVAVELVPEEWLEQPPGYIMVGIAATTDLERRMLRGHITHATCGGVELSRVE